MPNQQDILEFIRSHVEEHGQAPTVRELARTAGIHEATVAGHLRRLEKNGQITRTKRSKRGVKVCDDAMTSLKSENEGLRARIEELERELRTARELNKSVQKYNFQVELWENGRLLREQIWQLVNDNMGLTNKNRELQDELRLFQEQYDVLAKSNRELKIMQEIEAERMSQSKLRMGDLQRRLDKFLRSK